MKIGFQTLGKLGLPVALAIESRGHEVYGYDVRPEPYEYIRNKSLPFKEKGIEPLLKKTQMKLVDGVADLVANCDIIFTAPQTPHQERFEGASRLPDDRADFDYTFLKDAVKTVVDEATRQQKKTTLCVISTCLPGTFNRDIRHLLNEWVDYIYEPLYIAMGTVIDDYLDPEFVLIGQESEPAVKKLEEFYKTIHDKPLFKTDITTAEGIKVFYNTFITAKTLLANAWMQTAHKTGMNVDDITAALSLATDRLLSPKYLRGGGADSGGCHPRDLIALSWLGKQIDLKPNLFEMMAQARQDQTEWLASVVEYEARFNSLPVFILGRSFKPETNITTGSHAILLAAMLRDRGMPVVQYDPHVDIDRPTFTKGVYFVATEHDEFKRFDFPKGSIVFDLWRYLPENGNVKIVRIGNGRISSSRSTESEDTSARDNRGSGRHTSRDDRLRQRSH